MAAARLFSRAPYSWPMYKAIAASVAFVTKLDRAGHKTTIIIILNINSDQYTTRCYIPLLHSMAPFMYYIEPKTRD